MTYCSACGAKVSVKATYCMSCGANLAIHGKVDESEGGHEKTFRLNGKFIVISLAIVGLGLAIGPLSIALTNWTNQRDYQGKLEDLADTAPTQRGVFVNVGITCSPADKDYEWIELPLQYSDRYGDSSEGKEAFKGNEIVYFDNWQAPRMPKVGEGGALVVNGMGKDTSGLYFSDNMDLHKDIMGRPGSDTLFAWTRKWQPKSIILGDDSILIEVPLYSWKQKIALVTKGTSSVRLGGFFEKEASAQKLAWHEKDC